jgi:glycyl-tRNA synthetase beta chain
MANYYLLEVGTEELPVSFLQSVPSELPNTVAAKLTDAGVVPESITLHLTPRRLALTIVGLPEVTPEQKTLLKGPPAKLATDSQGNPSPAAVGFAKKVGAPDVTALSTQTVDGEAYLCFEQTCPGQPIANVLQAILPDAVLSLSGSHFMRWGAHTDKFSRPIRWLVSLWNDQLMPLSIGPVVAGVQSRGHRILASQPVFDIPSPQAYALTLANQGAVVVSQEDRKATIAQLLEAAAQKLGGTVPPNDDLLDTVTLLVESPSIVTGTFDPKFLRLPEAVITTVMAAHQKYFPVQKAGKLLNNFLTVSNGDPAHHDTIALGNQKVLAARLEDANFFFDDDQKRKLSERVDDLQGMTFQKGLGTLRDKAERLKSLSVSVAKALNVPASMTPAIERAAWLCKTDLTTRMVYELTELQGVMGNVYARLNGEHDDVATAIEEHYLPRFSGDAVAQSSVGIVLSLADKIDTLVAALVAPKAKIPTGSKDPLGVRRLAFGLLQTVLQHRLHLPMSTLCRAAYDQLQPTDGKASWDEVYSQRLEPFVIQRLRGLLLEDYRYDCIDAVLNLGGVLDELPLVCDRLVALKVLMASPERFQAFYEPGNRVARMLAGHYNPQATVSAYAAGPLPEAGDKALLALLQTLPPPPDAKDHGHHLTETMAVLVQAAPTIQSYFDEILVNAPDQALRQNRLNGLSILNTAYRRVAQLADLVV